MTNGQYINVNGLNTYYEVHGEGEPLLLMHGGFCTIDTFFGLTPELAKHYRVILPERRGHGRTADPGEISYQLMAQDTIAFMQALGIESAHLVGYSDGANTGMLVAIQRPDLAKKFVSIGGNFDAGGMTAEANAMMEHATPDSFIPMLVNAYKAVSPDGPDHFPIVFEKIMRMWKNEPKITLEDLGRIKAQTLVLVGDRDLMTLEHSVELFRAIPGAQLCIVPGTTHGLIFEKPALVNQAILNFLSV